MPASEGTKLVQIAPWLEVSAVGQYVGQGGVMEEGYAHLITSRSRVASVRCLNRRVALSEEWRSSALLDAGILWRCGGNPIARNHAHDAGLGDLAQHHVESIQPVVGLSSKLAWAFDSCTALLSFVSRAKLARSVFHVDGQRAWTQEVNIVHG